MTRLQRISAELGERRRRLLDIEGVDGNVPAERKAEAEGATLADRRPAGAVGHRAAGPRATPKRRALGMIGNGDGEAAEVRQLRGRVNLVDYLSPASAGAAISGAAGEFNAALGVPMAAPDGGVARALGGPAGRPA